MRKFWIKFDVKFGGQTHGVLMGCGVTAEDRNSAIELASRVIFNNQNIPKVISIIEDVELSQLDSKHVIPNIGNFDNAGIWFPALNSRKT